MPKTIQERMAQTKAAQVAGKYTRCPRCGEDTMKPILYTNALSRQYDIMICDSCGVDEAKMAFIGAPLPLAYWACLNEGRRDDFKAVAGEQALAQIETAHIPYLTKLFTLWTAQPDGADWEAYRLDAYERCPGLTTLWFQPFEARYTVADGTLVIRFRVIDGEPHFAADLLHTV